MKKMFMRLLAGMIALSPLQVYADIDVNPAANAWWLNIKFKPTRSVVHGLPLTRYSEDWIYAKQLSNTELSQKIPAKDLKKFKASRFAFERRVDLNKDGILELLVAGVYERQNGTKGRFLSIFQQKKLLKTITEDGEAGFSAILIDHGQAYWYFCMECGGGYKLSWNGSDYFLE